MPDQPSGVFYHVVRVNPPAREDFMSNEALGRRPRGSLSSRERDLWRGVSHVDSLEAAVAKVRDSPWLGSYVAELHIPSDAPARIEKTLRDPAHYTIWAEPADLLSWVVSARSVEALH